MPIVFHLLQAFPCVWYVSIVFRCLGLFVFLFPLFSQATCMPSYCNFLIRHSVPVQCSHLYPFSHCFPVYLQSNSLGFLSHRYPLEAMAVLRLRHPTILCIEYRHPYLYLTLTLLTQTEQHLCAECTVCFDFFPHPCFVVLSRILLLCGE